MMRKTTNKLADGREILYYDEDGAPIRDDTDTRTLGEVTLTSEIRYDPVNDDWVIIASHRQARTFHPPAAECPLCPSGEHPTEVPASTYDIVVFENRFPSLATTAAAVDPNTDPDEELFTRRPGRGRCEVVCFTSDHNLAFSQLSPERVRTVIDVLADRVAALSAMPDVEYVFPFENRGEAIGVTLSHPHGQIYAYPFVPLRVTHILENAQRYEAEHGRNLFGDVLAAERRSGRRVILQTEHWTAFVPAAARWPVEVHIYPNRRVPDLTALDPAERAELANVYLDVLKRLDELYDTPLPYIAAWNQAPVNEGRDIFHLHLEIMSIQRTADKLKYLAGSESGMGVWINDVTPEHRAQQLRDAHV